MRVSTEQQARIFNNAKAKGYLTISSYLRELALGKSLVAELQIAENNKMLKEVLQLLQKRTIA